MQGLCHAESCLWSPPQAMLHERPDHGAKNSALLFVEYGRLAALML